MCVCVYVCHCMLERFAILNVREYPENPSVVPRNGKQKEAKKWYLQNNGRSQKNHEKKGARGNTENPSVVLRIGKSKEEEI